MKNMRKKIRCEDFKRLRDLDIYSVKSFSQLVLKFDIAGIDITKDIFMLLAVGARFYSSIFKTVIYGICKNRRVRECIDLETAEFMLELFKTRASSRLDLRGLLDAFFEATANKENGGPPPCDIYDRILDKCRICMLKAIDMSNPTLLAAYFQKNHLDLVKRDKKFVVYLTESLTAKSKKSDKFKTILDNVEKIKRLDLNTSTFLN